MAIVFEITLFFGSPFAEPLLSSQGLRAEHRAVSEYVRVFNIFANCRRGPGCHRHRHRHPANLLLRAPPSTAPPTAPPRPAHVGGRAD